MSWREGSSPGFPHALPGVDVLEGGKLKFDDEVGAVCGCTVMCVQGVQEWAEDAALRSTSF